MTDDITKHKDWQAWQGALTEQCYYGATDNEMLKVLAPLIFAAGQADAQKWLPIESAPKDTFILGFFQDNDPKFSVKICAYLGWDNPDIVPDWCDPNNDWPLDVQPSHWMPLPAPPETGDK